MTTENGAAREAEFVKRIQALVDADSNDEQVDSAAIEFVECISLLEEILSVNSDLESPSGKASEVLTDHTCDCTSQLLPMPRRLGRFEIRRLLGHGGFGVVFLAFDERLAREIALKIPRPEILVSRRMRARFEREAQAAAVLDHAHIVPVFDSGEIGPVSFLVSGYVRGPSLAEWLKTQTSPLPGRRTAAVIARLADAVAHAHSRGVLHRDIKPSNVLLEPVGSSADADFPYVPKLTDFGLAKRLEADDQETVQGSLLGTPRYMSPEQAAGKHREVGVTSDIYGLGAILYELLTGSPPLVGQSAEETIRLIQEAQPSRASLRERRVPRDLETICFKCLEKEPSRRYQSAADLADDLRRYLTGEVVSARPIGAIPRVWRWYRRRPVIAALASGLSLSILLGSVVATVQWLRAEKYLTEARAATSLAQQNLGQAQHALFDLAWIVEESNARRDPGDRMPNPLQNKLEEYRMAGWLKPDAPLAVKPLVAVSHSFAAHDAAAAGDAQAAINYYNQALEYWCQVNAAKWSHIRGGYDRGFALCLLNAARHRCRLDQNGPDPLRGARELLTNVSRDYRVVPDNYVVVASTANELAYVHLEDRRWQDALEHFELARIAAELMIKWQPHARAHYQHLVARLSREIAAMHRKLKNGESVAKELDRAIEAARNSLREKPGVLPVEHELVLDLRALGTFYRERRDLVAAHETLEQALATIESAIKRDRVYAIDLARVTRELAAVFQARGLREEALAAFARSREAWSEANSQRSLAAEDLQMRAKVCHEEGQLALDLGRPDQARRAFVDGVAAYEQLAALDSLKPKELFEQAECHAGLGGIQVATDKLAAAIASYEAAVSLARPISTGRGVNPMFKGRYDKWTRVLEDLQRQKEKREGNLSKK